MSDAKRYKLINGLFQPRNPDDHARFSGEQRVVFAADYDALAAELAGCKQQLAVAPSYAKMIAHHGRQEQRIATLETALQKILAMADAALVETDNPHGYGTVLRVRNAEWALTAITDAQDLARDAIAKAAP